MTLIKDRKIDRYINLSNIKKKGKLLFWKESISSVCDFRYDDIIDSVKIVGYTPLTHMLQITFPNLKPDVIYYIHTDNFKAVKFGSMITDKYYNYKYSVGHIVDSKFGKVEILELTMMYDYTQPIKAYTVRCLLCGHERKIAAETVNYETHCFCNRCSFAVSYPEKFITNLLEQLNANFETQYNRKQAGWCQKYKYDFYINDISSIIEVNGEQHYVKMWSNSKHSLASIKENDLLKKKNAKDHVNNYIVLDCRKSKIEWIKGSVMESALPDLLSFSESDVDWNKCDSFARTNFILEASTLYNKGYSKKEIATRLNRSVGTVHIYLKRGTELNFCNITKPKINVYYGGVYMGKFDTITDIMHRFHKNNKKLHETNISKALRNKNGNIDGYSFVLEGVS